MIKVYTCNDEGTPSRAITAKDKDDLIEALRSFIEFNEKDPTIREFHCTITPEERKDITLVRNIKISNYIGNSCDNDIYRNKFTGNDTCRRNLCDRSSFCKKHNSRYYNEDYCERDFEI